MGGTASSLPLSIMRLDPDLPFPRYAHAGDAGIDLLAANDAVLAPGERALVPTGIAIALPEGCAGFVLPRSGLAFSRGLTVANAPGLIDNAYRGEIKIILVNLDRENPIEISRGDRIAQLVVQRVQHCILTEVEQLDVTVRGEDGFGSTGV